MATESSVGTRPVVPGVLASQIKFRNPTNVTTAASSTSTTAFSSLLDIIYPIGSVVMFMGEKSPSEVFGGTWTQSGVPINNLSTGVTSTGPDLTNVFLLGGAQYNSSDTSSYVPVGTGGGSEDLEAHTHVFDTCFSSTGTGVLFTAGSNLGLTASSSNYFKNTVLSTASSNSTTATSATALNFYNSSTLGTKYYTSTTGTCPTKQGATTTTDCTYTGFVRIHSSGTGDSGNLPPYVVTRIWRRQA